MKNLAAEGLDRLQGEFKKRESRAWSMQIRVIAQLAQGSLSKNR